MPARKSTTAEVLACLLVVVVGLAFFSLNTHTRIKTGRWHDVQPFNMHTHPAAPAAAACYTLEPHPPTGDHPCSLLVGTDYRVHGPRPGQPSPTQALPGHGPTGLITLIHPCGATAEREPVEARVGAGGSSGVRWGGPEHSPVGPWRPAVE